MSEDQNSEFMLDSINDNSTQESHKRTPEERDILREEFLHLNRIEKLYENFIEYGTVLAICTVADIYVLAKTGEFIRYIFNQN